MLQKFTLNKLVFDVIDFQNSKTYHSIEKRHAKGHYFSLRLHVCEARFNPAVIRSKHNYQ